MELNRPTEQQIQEFVKITVENWLKRTENAFKSRIQKNNLVDTQALLDSLVTDLKTSGNVTAEISFLQYGRYVEILGNKLKGVKVRKLSKNEKLDNKRPKLTRNRSRWYSKTKTGQITQLAESLATDYATVLATLTARTIETANNK
ncbi:MAG: hypothetical protein RIR36_1477 [Bacteroidota bacterium]|jgi:hypothetical protein